MLKSALPDYYATLGLHRDCTDAQIRHAYRLLAKKFHPDVNGGSREALLQTQRLNAAYEILSDAERRREYDRELAAGKKPVVATRTGKTMRDVAKEVHLRLDEFLRGVRLEVRVHEPSNPGGAEIYELSVPPETAPGTRFKLARDGGGHVVVRVKARPDFRFKVRGSDLQCDLNLKPERAELGGVETVRGLDGKNLRVAVPAKIARGEIIRIVGEGLPKTRGGRGDLLVRILYRVAVRITRAGK